MEVVNFLKTRQKARMGCASFACSLVLDGIHNREVMSKGFTLSLKAEKEGEVESSKSSQICPRIPISLMVKGV